MTHPTIEQQLAELNHLIAGLREQLSGPALETTLQPLLEKQAVLQAQLGGDQSVVSSQAGENIITGDRNITVYAEQGARVVIGDEAVEMEAVDAETQLGRYLQHLISHNRYLRLQSIRSGGRLVHIELDQIYVTLRATRRRAARADEAWLQAEAGLAPGERRRLSQTITETVNVSVNEALAGSRRLVVLGDPGSGKTTLLRYLTLLYARDVADGSDRVKRKLALDESGCLPILLELRRIGAFLKTHYPAEDGAEGHALLLDFLRRALRNERLDLPDDFFDEQLQSGRAVIFLDGLDEAADPDHRRRIARLVEAFCRAYPACRYVVTSRIAGYSGSARLGEDFSPTTF